MPYSESTLAAEAAWWGAVTAGHFVLTARWLAASRAHRDEWFFETALFGVAALLSTIHVLSMTVGLSLLGVTCVLTLGHALAVTRLRPRGQVPPDEAADLPTRLLEWAGIVVLLAMAFAWIRQSFVSLVITGNDAAHYHLPNAVNLALGTSVFDLPPTSHLYPMGMSALTAWFLLPDGTARLVDLVALVPFVLLAASVAYGFRLLTATSGLAWTPWLMVALFSTPLFRNASHLSADLYFTATTMAFGVALMRVSVRSRLADVTWRDWASVAASGGLLLGSKTTGLIAMCLLGGPAVAIGLWRLLTRPTYRVPLRWSLLIPVGLGLVMAVTAGGIWLVRNWWMWGSPVAPVRISVFGIALTEGLTYEPSYHASVLADASSIAGYNVVERLSYHVSRWLGPWYLWLLLPVVGTLAAIPLARLRGVAVDARAWVAAVVTIGSGWVMLLLLRDAPWTSLEWTQGLSLRYALPWFVLGPVVAAAALFSPLVRWYRWWPAVTTVGSGVIALALFLFGRAAAADQAGWPPWPDSAAVACAFGVVLVSALWPHSSRLRNWGFPVVVVSVAAGYASVGFTTSVVSQTDAHWDAEAVAAYQIVQEADVTQGRDCSATGRQFFIMTRFDEPMALQDSGARYSNRVFYIARDSTTTQRWLPAETSCDYVITTRDVLSTTKGTELLALASRGRTMLELGEAEPFVVLGIR